MELLQGLAFQPKKCSRLRVYSLHNQFRNIRRMYTTTYRVTPATTYPHQHQHHHHHHQLPGCVVTHIAKHVIALAFMSSKCVVGLCLCGVRTRWMLSDLSVRAFRLIPLVLMVSKAQRMCVPCMSKPTCDTKQCSPQTRRTTKVNRTQQIRKPHKQHPTTKPEVMYVEAAECLAMHVSALIIFVWGRGSLNILTRECP